MKLILINFLINVKSNWICMGLILQFEDITYGSRKLWLTCCIILCDIKDQHLKYNGDNNNQVYQCQSYRPHFRCLCFVCVTTRVVYFLCGPFMQALSVYLYSPYLHFDFKLLWNDVKCSLSKSSNSNMLEVCSKRTEEQLISIFERLK